MAMMAGQSGVRMVRIVIMMRVGSVLKPWQKGLTAYPREHTNETGLPVSDSSANRFLAHDLDQLEVSKEQLADVPADAPSLRYQLIKVVSKEPVR
jgi:hypothetical protein